MTKQHASMSLSTKLSFSTLGEFWVQPAQSGLPIQDAITSQGLPFDPSPTALYGNDPISNVLSVPQILYTEF